jgi:hypothetical protein
MYVTQPSLPNSTDGLYNTLCAGLKLSNQQFQMIQGVLPVPSDPSGLYNFFDGIPPESVATLYTSNPVNGLNGNMQIVIDDAIDSFLKSMALKNYTDSKYWVDGNVAVDPIYAPSFDSLMAAVNNGSEATLNFNSATADSDISDSWAKSSGSAGVGFWGEKNSSVSEALNQKASSSSITVDLYFNRYAYINIRAGGWFTQGFFTNQYKNPSKWTGGQEAWNAVFAAGGSCLYLANQVLLVNGYTYKVTSKAAYSQEDYAKVSTSKETNVWPFYTSSSSSSATQTFHYNSDQSITTTVTCNPGALQIFGMGVIPTAEAIGSQSVSRLI